MLKELLVVPQATVDLPSPWAGPADCSIQRPPSWWSCRNLSSAACLLAVLGGLHSAQAELIVAYNGANTPDGLDASEWLSGASPLPLTRGEGLSAGTGGTFNSSGWTDEATDYLEWGWASSPPLSLTDLDLRYDRSASGPSNLEIRLSVNGGPFESIFLDDAVSDLGEDNLDIDLSGFTQVTSATFRLFGTGASSSGGTFDIEPLTGVSPDRGIVVNGVTLVPEPSAIGLALAAAVAMALRRGSRPRRTCLT